MKKRIVKDACEGLFSTLKNYGLADANDTFTLGEKQIISKLLLIEATATDFQFSLCLFETALKLAINFEKWNEVNYMITIVSSMLDKELEKYSTQKIPKSKKCFTTILNETTWTDVKNGTEICETLNLMLAQQTETKLKSLSNKLANLLTFTQNEFVSEAIKQKNLALAAIGFQLLPFIWHSIQLKQKPFNHKKYINEIHTQAAFFVRSLTSMTYLIKNGSSNNSLKWIILTQKCIKNFSKLAVHCEAVLLVYEYQEKSKTVMMKVKNFFENGKGNEIPHKLFKEVYDLRLLASSCGLLKDMATLSEQLAILNKYIHKSSPHLSDAWMQTAKQERQMAKNKS
jgi:hypothetical protein